MKINIINKRKRKIYKKVNRNMQNIIEIAKLIEKNGGRLYLVGGAVRDKLLNLEETHDKDYCITGLSKEKFQEIFPHRVDNAICACYNAINSIQTV